MRQPLTFIGMIFAIALSGNCKVSRQIAPSSEAIEHVSTFWKVSNNIDTPNFTITEKAWYEDSIGVTQICQIWTVETDTSKTTTIRTIGYRFVDLRKKWAYEYGGFSDTASILRKYAYTDTTLFPGGWNFANRTSMVIDSTYVLPDTIINAINFKQRKMIFRFNQVKFEGIGSFRCDSKRDYFQIDTALSKQTGCTLVFFRMNPSHNPHARLDREIRFIANQFPDSVKKVIGAWKRNTDTYPVDLLKK